MIKVRVKLVKVMNLHLQSLVSSKGTGELQNERSQKHVGTIEHDSDNRTYKFRIF